MKLLAFSYHFEQILEGVKISKKLTKVQSVLMHVQQKICIEDDNQKPLKPHFERVGHTMYFVAFSF